MKTTRTLLVFFALLLALAVVGCSGEESPTPPEPTVAVPSSTPAPTATPAPTPTPRLGALFDTSAQAAPRVISWGPEAGKTMEAGVEVVFNQPMDPTSVAQAFSVTAGGEMNIPGEITWTSSRSFVYKPDMQMLSSLGASGAELRARLSEAAKSASGLALLEPFSFSFQSSGRLAVSQTLPVDGAREVLQNTVITVIFNRPIVPLQPVEGQALPQPLILQPAAEGAGEWLNTSVYIFRPSRPLQGGVTYQASIDPNLTSVDGEVLGEAFTWFFTTIQPTAGALTIVGVTTNPPAGYAGVLLDQAFALDFNQPMDQASVENNLQIATAAGRQPVPLQFKWNETSTTVVFTPTVRMQLGTEYLLYLAQFALDANQTPLRSAVQWSFFTVNPPAVLSTYPQNGAVQPNYDGSVRIDFASPMNINSLVGRVILTPPLDPDVQWYYDSWGWGYSAWGLEPSTNYTLELLPGMEDIYGNRIESGQVVQFTTGPYYPSLWLDMPFELAMFRAQVPQEFYLNTVNVRQVNLKVYRLAIGTFAEMLGNYSSRFNYTPSANSLVWEETRNIESAADQSIANLFTPTSPDGGLLPQGAYLLMVESAQIPNYGQRADETRLFVVSALNITMKSTANEVLAWATDLETGSPLSGVNIGLYDNQMNLIASQASDTSGLAKFNGLKTPEEYWQARYAMVDNETLFAVTSSQWGSGVSFYDLGIWESFYSVPNQLTTYIYTDRPLYRPGQPIAFKGVVRFNDDLNYRVPAVTSLLVSIQDYQNTVYEATLPLNEFGTFSGQFTLDNDAALGAYTIQVTPANADYSAYGYFTVAEYRRPDFMVQVQAAREDVLVGETMGFDLEASYFFGGGVSDALLDWTVTAVNYTFNPGGDLSGFSFSESDNDLYYYDFGEVNYPEIIAQGSARTGADGKYSQSLPADLGDAATSRSFTFEATLYDLAGTSVSGRADVIVHKSAVYPGVRPLTYVGEANKEQTFEVVAVDWNAQTLAGQALRVEIVERRWYSVQEQDPSGTIKWTSSVEEVPVALFENVLTGADGRAQVRFTPPNGGTFKAIVSTLDASGNEGRAAAYMWAWDPNFGGWRQTDDRRITLVADKEAYTPGETARILIASPFSKPVYALLTVERGKVKTQQVVRLESSSYLYELPITPDMAPGVFFSALLVEGAETSGKPDFRMGMVQLDVARVAQELQVEIAASPAQAGPGDEVTFQVTARDYTGAPVQAEFSLALVDLATLTLLGPNALPSLDFFYGSSTLGVQTSVPIVLNMDHYNEAASERMVLGRGGGSGGGAKGEGVFGVPEVREDFPDTAYWQGQLTTGADGSAQVTIRLPDNLTTWRMDARAVTRDTRVGEATLDVVSTKPLLVRPQTPRYFLVGDQVTLSAIIHNNTETDLDVTAGLSASGVELSSPAQQAYRIPAGGRERVDWQVTVLSLPEKFISPGQPAGRVDLIFTATAGEFTDASRPPVAKLEGGGLPVYQYEVMEIVGTAGLLDQSGSRVEGVALVPGWDLTQGLLTVQLAPSLAAGMAAGLDALAIPEYESIEATVSSFLPAVMLLRAYEAAGLQTSDQAAELNGRIERAVQRLLARQNPDGGWGWWANDESDLQTTAYVVLGLLEAGKADLAGDALLYLQRKVIGVSDRTPQNVLDLQAFVLYVLARAGQPNVSIAVSMFDVRQGMSLYARAYLAQALHLVDPGDPRLPTLLSDFNTTALVSATGMHWEEGRRDPWGWNTDTRTTAIVLNALIQIDPQNSLNANAVRWLMSNRSGSYWATSQETAWSLMAFAAWVTTTGELNPAYVFGASLNGELLGETEATPASVQETQTYEVPLSALTGQELNRLIIARDAGPGVLYYTAHLKAYVPVENVQPLNRGLIVSRSYYRLDGEPVQINEATSGEMLFSRLTLVVPQTAHHVVVEDPLPAGLEPVNQALETSAQWVIPNQFDYETLWRQGWGWWYFNNIQLKDEKVVLSAYVLPPGTYIYNTLVQAATPGVYHVIPPSAFELYFPEVFGRGAGTMFTVNP